MFFLYFGSILFFISTVLRLSIFRVVLIFLLQYRRFTIFSFVNHYDTVCLPAACV